MDADLDTLATALYVRTDDLLKICRSGCRGGQLPESRRRSPTPNWSPWRVMQALPGFVSETRWLRHARKCLHGLFPYLPGQPGYNKRLRKLAATMTWLIRML